MRCKSPSVHPENYYFFFRTSTNKSPLTERLPRPRHLPLRMRRHRHRLPMQLPRHGRHPSRRPILPPRILQQHRARLGPHGRPAALRPLLLHRRPRQRLHKHELPSQHYRRHASPADDFPQLGSKHSGSEHDDCREWQHNRLRING